MKKLYLLVLILPLIVYTQDISIYNPEIVPTYNPKNILGKGLSKSEERGVVLLDFEGLGNVDYVQDFYNGGESSQGLSGTDYGIYFNSTALSVVAGYAGGSGNFQNEPSPSTILFFLEGSAAMMNVPDGFTKGFSFYYSSIDHPGFVEVYDELDGTGNLLATIDLQPLGSLNIPGGLFNIWRPIGVDFEGTAKSIAFGGVANQIGFDDVTFGSSVPLNTTIDYVETFVTNGEAGWAFTSYGADISTEGGKLNFHLESEDYQIVYMLPPIGATKGDFSVTLNGINAENADMGWFGRAGFNSFVMVGVEENEFCVIYADNIQSYTNVEPVELYCQAVDPAEINHINLTGLYYSDNLSVYAYLNNELVYSGVIEDVDEGLYSGQIALVMFGENIDLSVEEVSISYNPAIDNSIPFIDEFDNPHSPWIRFGDFETVGHSVFIEDGKLKFNHIGSEETALLAASPLGAVGDFTMEVSGGGGDMEATVSMGRFFDYLHYTALWIEEDEIFIGFAKGSYEPVVINSAPFDYTVVDKLKFGAHGNAQSLTLQAWVNDQLVLTGVVDDPTERLAVGHPVVAIEQGSVIDAYFDYFAIELLEPTTDVTYRHTSISDDFRLYQNYPNPFNPSTVIEFSIPQVSNVSLSIFDLLGKEITTLVKGPMAAGTHRVTFDAVNLPSGVYIYRLQADGYVESKTLLLVR